MLSSVSFLKVRYPALRSYSLAGYVINLERYISVRILTELPSFKLVNQTNSSESKEIKTVHPLLPNFNYFKEN